MGESFKALIFNKNVFLKQPCVRFWNLHNDIDQKNCTHNNILFSIGVWGYMINQVKCVLNCAKNMLMTTAYYNPWVFQNFQQYGVLNWNFDIEGNKIFKTQQFKK